MHEAGRVRRLERRGRLAHHSERVLRRARPGASPLPERLPVDKLHRHVERALGLAEIVDHDNVGVIEGRGGARFVEQAFPARVVVRELGRKHLDREASSENRILGQEDATHPALPDRLQDPVPSHRSPDHDARIALAGPHAERPSG